jgi:hypothetical protein
MDELPSVRASDTRSIGAPQWMTYAEAAQRFGISSEAVRQIALRRKWPRRRPNDDPFGRVQVQIPPDEEVRPRTAVQRPDEHHIERPSDTRSMAGAWKDHDAYQHTLERLLRDLRVEAT